MFEVTVDPTVFIVARDTEMIEYLNDVGERWRIYGTCNKCGACEVGGEDSAIIYTGVEIGQPNACYNIEGENRLDNPVRPEISELTECVLTGEYL